MPYNGRYIETLSKKLFINEERKKKNWKRFLSLCSFIQLLSATFLFDICCCWSIKKLHIYSQLGILSCIFQVLFLLYFFSLFIFFIISLSFAYVVLIASREKKFLFLFYCSADIANELSTEKNFFFIYFQHFVSYFSFQITPAIRTNKKKKNPMRKKDAENDDKAIDITLSSLVP